MWIVQTIDPVIAGHAQLIVHQQFPGSRKLWTRARTEYTVQAVSGERNAAGIQRIDFFPDVALDCKKPTRAFRALAGRQENLSVQRDCVAQTFTLHSLCSS